MAAKKTRTANGKASGATSRKAKSGKAQRKPAKPISVARSEESFSYLGVRLPIIVDALKNDFGGSATQDELFKHLKTTHGEFNKPRRIGSTRRKDAKVNGDKSMLILNGRQIELRTMPRAMRSALAKRSK